MLCHENYFFPQCSGSCKGVLSVAQVIIRGRHYPPGPVPHPQGVPPVIEFLNLLLTLVQVGTQIIAQGLVSLSVG